MKLDVIERLLTKYESSAVCIADERTQKVMFFNQLVKELCPEVEKDMNIDDFFGRILKKFDIETKNENTLLISDRTSFIPVRYFLSENKIALDAETDVVCFIFHRIKVVESFEDMICKLNSKLFLSDCDSSVIINLDDGNYYTSFVRGMDGETEETSDDTPRNWESQKELFASDFVSDEVMEDYMDKLSIETLREKHRSGVEVERHSFEFYLDGERAVRNAKVYYSEINSTPVACIKIFDLFED